MGQIIKMADMGRVRMPKNMAIRGGVFTNASFSNKEAVRHWNAENRSLLNRFGLQVVGVMDWQIRESTRERGDFEVKHSEGISLAAALPALATAFEARGSVLRLPSEVTGDAEKKAKAVKKLKSQADMFAVSSMNAALRNLVQGDPRYAIHVAVGEGERQKEGEGRNPTLYPGQLLAEQRMMGLSPEQLISRGVSVVNGAFDPIDGTGKTVNYLPSAVTSLVLVNGPITMVPDGRFEKLVLPAAAANQGLSLADPFEKIIQGISDGQKIKPENVNTFMLDRPNNCHPDKQLVEKINVVTDADGDLIPGITSVLQPGLIVNGQPLHTMMGNSGGAAEFLLAAIPGMWLGGEAYGRMVSDQMKKLGWDKRFEYTPNELADIKAAGLETERIYPITEFVPGIKTVDGVAAFGGITDNYHFPYLDGVILGNRFAQVDVVKIGASGAVLLRRFVFTFNQSNEETADLFRPVLLRLAKVNPKDLRGEVREILKNEVLAGALRDEFGTAYYDVFTLSSDGRFVINQDAAERNLTERDKALLTELQELAPDWFSA
jgi:fructose-1,6-bisphosphatase/sedoheptulose 1,7-bisphosphatase-like protein